MIETGISLQQANTLALPGRAALFLKANNETQLTDPALRDTPKFILGGGSNLVLTGDVDRLVIQMDIRGKALQAEDAEAWYITAQAGENWHDFVQWTLAQGWPGLENLSLIPGTVGAAPIQNIGAYGLEVADYFHSARCWDFEKQQFFTVDRETAGFGYRDSLFKQAGWHLTGQVAITQVAFRLPKKWTPNLRYGDVANALGNALPTPVAIANAIIAIRQSKLPDPAFLPNAGSFFHNPIISAKQADALRNQYPTLPIYPHTDGQVKVAAGWLIDQAGWKGKSLGPVGMYEKQALVLVNHGGATGTDVRATMQAVQAAVQAKFGVALHPEPVFL